MSVWVVANQKGGVGKTTTTVTLAGLLAERGKRVLMVDMDPHGSLSSYFGLDPDRPQRSLYDVFVEAAAGRSPRLQHGIQKIEVMDGLFLLPASTSMATLDRQLGNRTGMGRVLKTALGLDAKDYDHVLLDCPPVLGLLMVNALVACDLLIIPVQTEFLAIKGLERMLHTLGMISRSRGIRVPAVILPTLFDQRTRACSESLQQIQQHFHSSWGAAIPLDTRIREASRTGKPPSLATPGSRAVQAYEQFLESLLMIGQAPARQERA